jgi:hypothetical protein
LCMDSYRYGARSSAALCTALDPEEIGALASALDDVIDWVEEGGRRIYLFHVTDCAARG